jgi:hypothetical protein
MAKVMTISYFLLSIITLLFLAVVDCTSADFVKSNNKGPQERISCKDEAGKAVDWYNIRRRDFFLSFIIQHVKFLTVN